MKKLLLPFLFLPLANFCQRVFERQSIINRPYLESEGENWLVHIAPFKKPKTIEWKGQKATDRSYTALDEKGYLIETRYTGFARGFLFYHKQHFWQKLTYTNLLATKVEFYNKKGELDYAHHYEFFTPNKVRVSKTYEKGKLIFEGVSKFNADSTTAEYKALKYKNGAAKQTIRYENDYYANKQKKETREYNKKNKLKQVWKYDCDPKGAIPVKKTNQICKNVGSDNKGREIEIVFNTNYKGKKTKTIYTFYKVNGKRFNVTSEWYTIKDGKEKKWYEEHYPDSVDLWYNYKYYDKKGRLAFEEQKDYTQFNSTGALVKKDERTSYHKGKISYKTVQSFNEKGLFIKNEFFNGKQELRGKTLWEYGGDTLVTTKNYGKKGALKKTQTCHISYY